MVGDLRQHMAPPGFGADPAQLGRADQRVNVGRTFAAAVGASEQEIAPADSYAAQCPFGCRVVDLDDAVVAVAQQDVQDDTDLSDSRESD